MKTVLTKGGRHKQVVTEKFKKMTQTNSLASRTPYDTMIQLYDGNGEL